MAAVFRQQHAPGAVFGAQEITDTVAPVLTGAITVGAKTSSTIAYSFPAGTDNVGITAYDVRVDGGAWVPIGASPSGSLTGRTALTSYLIEVSARDAVGLRSNILSVTTRTYRAGALGSTILLTTGPIGGNPAGILFNDVESGDEAKWFSFVITTPVPSGVLDIDPDGTFTFTGSTDVSFEYQLEVDGANFGAPIPVTLYGRQAVPVNSTSQSTATPSVDTLTAEAIPVNVRSGSSVTQGRATQVHVATPAGAIGRSTTTTPSVSVGGVTATPVNAISVSTTTRSFAGSTVIGVPVNATCTARATRARAIVLSSLPSADRAIYTGPPTRAIFSR